MRQEFSTRLKEILYEKRKSTWKDGWVYGRLKLEFDLQPDELNSIAKELGYKGGWDKVLESILEKQWQSEKRHWETLKRIRREEQQQLPSVSSDALDSKLSHGKYIITYADVFSRTTEITVNASSREAAKEQVFWGNSSVSKIIDIRENSTSLAISGQKKYGSFYKTKVITKEKSIERTIYKNTKTILTEPYDLKTISANRIFEAGVLFYGIGEYEKAIDKFKSAIKINPKLSKAYAMRSCSYVALENFSSSVIDYKKAYRLNREEAELIFKEINSVRINFSNKEVKRILSTMMSIGLHYYDKSLFNESIDVFTRIIKIDPKNFCAYNHRSSAYSAAKRYQRAIDDLGKAEDIVSENQGELVFEKFIYLIGFLFITLDKAYNLLPDFSEEFNAELKCFQRD